MTLRFTQREQTYLESSLVSGRPHRFSWVMKSAWGGSCERDPFQRISKKTNKDIEKLQNRTDCYIEFTTLKPKVHGFHRRRITKEEAKDHADKMNASVGWSKNLKTGVLIHKRVRCAYLVITMCKGALQ